MRSALESPPAVSAASVLRLVWQDIETRQFVEVGQLHELTDGAFTFAYTEGADHARFRPLAEFPDRHAVYQSSGLPAFFGNRVMSHHRESFPQYCRWLGLSEVSTPMEILARTGGARVTDTFHVVDSFSDHDGQRRGRFFASGVRYIVGADERLRKLQPGQELVLRQDPLNPVNPLAILLDVTFEQPVGWVPDWLLTDVQAMFAVGSVKVSVAQVNVDAPAHLRLMCLLEAASSR